jgi:hypothetical protein
MEVEDFLDQQHRRLVRRGINREGRVREHRGIEYSQKDK